MIKPKALQVYEGPSLGQSRRYDNRVINMPFGTVGLTILLFLICVIQPVIERLKAKEWVAILLIHIHQTLLSLLYRKDD